MHYGHRVSCSLAMAPRSRYFRISPEVRKRIVDAYLDGEDWKQMARFNGVNTKTAYNWINVNSPSKIAQARGGSRGKKLTDSEIDEILEWLSDDASLTLAYLRSRISVEFGKDVCLSTISNYLDGRCVTLKKLCHVPEGRNSAANKEKRIEYVRKVDRLMAAGKCLIWMDETNFNLFCTRTIGRAERGKRANMKVANSRGANIHLIGAMTTERFLKHSLMCGSFTKEKCSAWVRDLLDQVEAAGSLDRVVLICDNAPCHSGLDELFQDTRYKEATLLRLGPYSPMLNPIEGVWSVVKAAVKRDLRDRNDAIMDGNPRRGCTKKEWRIQQLEEIATNAMLTVKPEHCTKFASHVCTFHPAVLNGEDL